MNTRWTPEVLDHVKELRYNHLWTLQMIADYHGVTRERIRQVLGYETGGRCVTSRAKRMMLDDLAGLSVQEISSKYGLSKERVVAALGYKISVEPVISVLQEYGMEVRKDESKSGAFILVNDHSVHVSFAYKSTTPKNHIISSSYAFRVENDKDYEFSLLCIKDTMEMFVVPASELVGKSQIRFVWDDRIKIVHPYFRRYHYQKYFNRFDFLR